MKNGNDLTSLSDQELMKRLHALADTSRRVEADLVAHIGEVDARRLWAHAAVSSMFRYCTDRLHLSEDAAYRRIEVARAARKHPVLLDMLRDGRQHLTGLSLLVRHLTPENRDHLLARATHRTRREIERLIAEIAPQPDVPERIRKLPVWQPLPGVGQGEAPATLIAGASSLEGAVAPRELVCGRDAGFPAPPAQIPASGTTALGSCLGSEGKALLRPGVKNAGAGQEAPDDPEHLLPGDVAFVTAPAQAAPPHAGHLVVESLQGVEVQGHRVVVEVPTEDRGQPFTHLGDGVVPAPPEEHLDLPELGSKPLAHGQPYERETPFPRLPADVREAEEVERLGLTPSLPLSVGRRVATELDQAGLFGM
jgi:hypothetical protein